ncbi:MAG: hypothetical protein LBH07_04170 [Treponema sp.]|jgi:GTP:adenosylcobinamide-phosphate guanylyltransferase|nr:hypothetical protein [Treponema sp.]
MKKILKLFGFITLVALITFSMVACDDGGGTGGGGGGGSGYSLNGVWVENRSGEQITASGSTSVISRLGSYGALGTDAVSKGYIKIGVQVWRSLTSTGNLTWSGQSLLVDYNTNAPTVALGTSWGNATFTMSANGQTLTVSGRDTSGTYTNTYTRSGSSYSLNGIWEESRSGEQITASGSTSVISRLGSYGALGTDAVNKGYIKVGVQVWRSLSSTGNLTWSGQSLLVDYNTNAPTVALGTSWGNATFTMSANGQTVTVSGRDTSGSYTNTYTRR